MGYNSASYSRNKYLEGLEIWNEKQVPYYKKKVRAQIGQGYLCFFMGYLLIYAYTMVLTFLTAFLSNLLTNSVVMYIFNGIFAIITLVVFIKYGIKKTNVFIKDNHGEVGHYKEPFARKTTFHLIFSILIVIGLIAIIIVFGSKFEDGADCSLMMISINIPLTIVGFFIGTKKAIGDARVCPICGRLNTIETIDLKKFGHQVDGSHTSSYSTSEHTGDKITTTTWSDGSVTKTTQPIYSLVSHVSVYSDHSELVNYKECCRECTYSNDGTYKRTWSVKEDEYDV